LYYFCGAKIVIFFEKPKKRAEKLARLRKYLNMRFYFLHPTKSLGSPFYKGNKESRMLSQHPTHILLTSLK
jgi:hypothetical protein